MGGCAVMCCFFFHRTFYVIKLILLTTSIYHCHLNPYYLYSTTDYALKIYDFSVGLLKNIIKTSSYFIIIYYYSSLSDWYTFTSDGLTAVQILINSTQHKNPCPPYTLFMALLRGGIVLSTKCLQDIMTWSGPVCLQLWCTVLITFP